MGADVRRSHDHHAVCLWPRLSGGRPSGDERRTCAGADGRGGPIADAGADRGSSREHRGPASLLAVMSTKPAAGFLAVIRECAIATVVAGLGAFAVEAYQAEVSLERVGYLALGLSLLGGIVLGYRLGAGLHGLGTRGSITVISGLGLLFLTLAYTEALSRWGPPGLTDGIDEAIATIRTAVGAVPRPVEVLVGFPALAWGVSTRARRRQGWWVCVFGAAGLSVVAVSLLDARVSLLESGVSLLFSAVLGLLLGYLVIRADQFFTGARGRGARRLEEASAHRPCLLI